MALEKKETDPELHAEQEKQWSVLPVHVLLQPEVAARSDRRKGCSHASTGATGTSNRPFPTRHKSQALLFQYFLTQQAEGCFAEYSRMHFPFPRLLPRVQQVFSFAKSRGKRSFREHSPEWCWGQGWYQRADHTALKSLFPLNA